MTVLFARCPACPRDRPGPCFAQTRSRGFCDRYAAGDRKHEPLLAGEVEPVPAPAADGPRPVPTPEPPGTPFRLMVLAVAGMAPLCRSCAVGCQQAKCFAGLGDRYGNAPLSHCYACVTGARERPGG